MSTPVEESIDLSCIRQALREIDASDLAALGLKGKTNPSVVVTLNAKIVCEGQFRNLNMYYPPIQNKGLAGRDGRRIRP